MAFKMGSLVMVLMMVFFAKISFESVFGTKGQESINARTTASIDQSYTEHITGAH